MFRCSPLLASTVAITLISTTTALAETSYHTVVLEGPDGVSATLLDVNYRQHYLEFQGTGTRLDGVVLPVDEGALDWNSRAFTVNYHGLHYPVIHEREGQYSFRQLYADEPIELTINVLASEDVDGRSMLERHEAQKKDGTLAALRAFNRGERIKLLEHQFEQENASRKAVCNTDVAVTVDWSTFDDRHFSEAPNPAWCSTAIESLRSLCADSGPFSFLSVPPENMATINAIACRAGTTNTFKIENGTVTFEFSDSLQNADELGVYTLYNALQ